jgi:vacuolar-type H+-ATPase subunit H
MTKNLSALAYMELEIPEHADRYKTKVLEAKRERSRIRQKAMSAAYKVYAESDKNTPE